MPSLSFRHFGQIGAVALLCALILAGPVLAQSRLVAGDGSGADNQRLLPGLYPAMPIDALALDLEALREPYEPAFNIDWAVALRGSYTKTGDGERYEAILAPSVSLDHAGSRLQVKLDADAEVSQPLDNQIDVSGLRLDLATDYALDSGTTLDADVDLSLTRDQADLPGVANGITEAPQTFVGSLGGGVTRQFGRFNVGVSGTATRSAYGATSYEDGSVVDNSEQNLWTLDSGLRLGLQVTPIFEVFTEGELGRELFDEASSVLQAKPDATNSAIKAGISGQWSDVLAAQASVGLGWRRFDAAGLTAVRSQLYDARLVFNPDPTWQFTAGLSTTVAPPGPDSPGLTRLEYAVDADAEYTVNSWLALRALADWTTSRYDGSGDREDGYGYGLGADYTINAHTALTADYGYEHAEDVDDEPEDAHRVMLGVTVSR